jgi:hypothetical protein
MSQRRSKARRRKKRVRQPQKPAVQESLAKEALWTSVAALVIAGGITAHIVWSFRVRGYAHIDIRVLLVGAATIILAGIFVSMWWSRRRKVRQRSAGRLRRRQAHPRAEGGDRNAPISRR